MVGTKAIRDLEINERNITTPITTTSAPVTTPVTITHDWSNSHYFTMIENLIQTKKYSMINKGRLRNIEEVIRDTVLANVEGDFVECGVWQGGASMLARIVLNAYNQQHRYVYLIDSFQGLPIATNNVDGSNKKIQIYIGTDTYLAVGVEKVKENFYAVGIDPNAEASNIRFIKGYFNESLPQFNLLYPHTKIAILRMDGDMYSSTLDQLYYLFNKVQINGTIIIDDYFDWPLCKKAVDEFFDIHNYPNIRKQLKKHQGNIVYFTKTQHIENLNWTYYRQAYTF